MQRKMKVYYKTNNNYITTPMLKISNKFLANNGFKVGDKVKVQYEPDKIIIRKQ